MNYGKYDTIVANVVFICIFAMNCLDKGNQLLIITNTMNIINQAAIKFQCIFAVYKIFKN